MELFKLVCPACGADISLEKETRDCFCPYCGTKFKFDDGVQRSEHTVYYRDEAKLRELELQEEARLRAEKERLEEDRKIKEAELRKKQAFKRWYIIVGVWAGLFVLVTLTLYLLERFSPQILEAGESSKIDAYIMLGLLFAPFVLPVFYPFKYSAQTKAVVWFKWAGGMFLSTLILIEIFSTVFEPTSERVEVFPKDISEEFVKTAVEAPKEVFNSPASENHMGGLHCYVQGKVTKIDTMKDEQGFFYKYMVLETNNGEIAIVDEDQYGIQFLEAQKASGEIDEASYAFLHKMYEASADKEFPAVHNYVKVYCVYGGFSETMKMPSFHYGYPMMSFIAENLGNVDTAE